ncbi:MAG: DUF3373 domain-containing protein [Thermoanaerobaculia bacterium]|nr:MAG: DUF3373 domain-containing protein [Thermoanaerobaculia bacterium]MBZ0101854.1 DUF3373 domain-containing protein [Thermoanaerobaculia bacterium]
MHPLKIRLRTLPAIALAALLPFAGAAVAQETDVSRSELDAVKEKIRELEKKLRKGERKDALDRVDLSGDFRFEAHSIEASIPDHFDGLALQNLMVNTLFFVNTTGTMPGSIEQIGQHVASHYGDYLWFTSNFTFADLQAAMASFPPAMQQQLFGMLMPSTYQAGYDADNSILYTNRLRLRLDADLGEDVTFSGRLSMYKTFGDSTGVQVFNGQPNSINLDGTTTGVPNSDILRVERAYFNWSNIGGIPLYLSIGRRPSTDGAPLNFRQDEPRGGTPLGSIIDYQFDGITVGYHLSDESTVRLCYGLGYESGFGNGDVLKLPADRLADTQFLGLNWDILDTDRMFIQTTLARAFDVADGFNGLAVFAADPLTGNPINAPVVLRFSPSANLGDIDLASVVLIREDGPFDWFVSANYMRSDPEAVTTPFGGLFSDPFEVPEEQDATMWYAGLRYNLKNDRTRIGVEYNHGSEYWFNFAQAEDDLIAPKTSARGDVWELYLTHRITRRFLAKLDWIDYSYDYSGSGWHVGSPKSLDSVPLLGFPTYDQASKVSFSLIARF